MTSEDKKTRLKAWKKAEKEKAKSALPGPIEEMRALFDHLDRWLGEQPCDHTRQATDDYLRQHDLAQEAYLAWFDTHGGFCDCEILANCEERLDETL
jgi:hypothetical protein